jgi:hypothetical protein
MVEGLDIFRHRFADFTDSLMLIGGAACDEWFGDQGLSFRATKDLDLVLIAEVLSPECVRALLEFVEDGRYATRERTEEAPVLYRFAKPATDGFPGMLEFFSRKPDGLDLREDQHIVPIAAGAAVHSLSAILLNEAYYTMLVSNRQDRGGLSVATPPALIALKARAWIDLTARKEAGETVDSRDIKKHRTDVFRLAATLPGDQSVDFGETLRADLRTFLDGIPTTSAEWSGILASLKPTFGSLQASTLIEDLSNYFQL